MLNAFSQMFESQCRSDVLFGGSARNSQRRTNRRCETELAPHTTCIPAVVRRTNPWDGAAGGKESGADDRCAGAKRIFDRASQDISSYAADSLQCRRRSCLFSYLSYYHNVKVTSKYLIIYVLLTHITFAIAFVFANCAVRNVCVIAQPTIKLSESGRTH